MTCSSSGQVLNALTVTAKGKPAAANTVARRRAVFHSVLGFAVELGHLSANPLSRVKWKAPRTADQSTSERSPTTTRPGRCWPPSAARAVLRPPLELRRADLVLPAAGWGALRLHKSNPVTRRGLDRRRPP